MICTHPVHLKSGLVVPCGKCLMCKTQKTKEWTVRCLAESIYWNEKCMLTLTYDDLHVPVGGSLVKRDLQLFIKRLRKLIFPQKIKYFACGEYGDTTFRPHYHLLLLGCQNRDLLSRCWDKGFISLRIVTVETVRYVCGYVYKKYGAQWNKQIYENNGLEVPFQLQSQGLGFSFAKEHDLLLKENLCIPLDKCPISLPRYFVKKLEIDSSILHRKWLDRQPDSDELDRRVDRLYNEFIDNFSAPFDCEDLYRQEAEKLNVQREKNFVGKRRLRGRRQSL